MLSLLSNVLNTSSDGLFVCNIEGYPILYNEALLEMTNLSHAFINSYVIYDAVEMMAVPKTSAAIVLETKQACTTIIEYEHGKKCIVTATPYLDADNEILFVVSNLRDITEMNRLQKELEETQQIKDMYQKNLEQLRNEIGNQQHIIYQSKNMKQVMSLAERFAENDLPILLLGESGVGKDVLANFIHEQSKRKGPLIKINCGAIPDHLLESELFGYEKGAFTSASQAKKGLFEAAQDGTIFLDEIGDLPYSLQVKLLNVVQDYKIRRLGGTEMKEVNVRIITATNADIEGLVKQKAFRLDLYYRLNVLSIHIPPLRERKEDIPSFVFYYLRQFEQKYHIKKKVDNKVLQQFMAYGWPGNIRELKNLMERLYHLSEGTTITTDYLPENLLRHRSGLEKSEEWSEHDQHRTLKEAVTSFEQAYISRALSRSTSLQECASQLGISISSLVRKKRSFK
ncbi:sigma-54 interaction domain-containing protein [Peribacillus butanolivorans]